MSDLDRLLAAPPADPRPVDFVVGVRQRARQLRRRRAGVAGAALSVAAVVFASLTHGGSSTSLEPVEVPTLPPAVSPVARPAGELPASAPSRSAAPVIAVRPTALPTLAPPLPSLPPLPFTFAVYRGTPPPAGEGGLRCVRLAGQGPAFTTSFWRTGPDGWCYQASHGGYQDPAPRTRQADLRNIGLWLCRAQGQGAGVISLTTPPRLVITRGQTTGESTFEDTGEVVFDSAKRWPGSYRSESPRRIAVADNACVLLYVRWDSRDTGGEAVPEGDYFWDFLMDDPAWRDDALPPGSGFYHRPGEVH